MDRERKLPIPLQCDACCSTNINFVQNGIIYGSNKGEYPWIYHCGDCGASVGCHKGTLLPLGRMANKQTRQLRLFAHKAFDPIWKLGFMSRNDAYKWLGDILKIEEQDCHFSWLTDEQLRQAIIACDEYMKTARPEQVRRKEKKDARRTDTVKRTIEKFKRRRKAKESKFPRRYGRNKPANSL